MFSTLCTKINNPKILMESLKDLGLDVREDEDIRGYNGQSIRADIVVRLEGEYDLGFCLNIDGNFDIVADLWGVAKKHNQSELINSIYRQYGVRQNY